MVNLVAMMIRMDLHFNMSRQTELNFMGKTCSHCGTEAGRLTEADSKLFCPPCLSTLYFLCNTCKDFHVVSSRKIVRAEGGYGKLLCPKCFDETNVLCAHCGYGCKKADSRQFQNQTYCNICYDSMFTCVSCQQRLFKDRLYDSGLCQQCWTDERRAINTDHLAKAPLEFKGNGPLFYGIELEVECDEKLNRRAVYAKDILKLFGGFVITKHDGSIKDPATGRVVGFEIVTVPASREYQREKWNYFFDNKPKGLRSFDTTTCGLHFHVSRIALTQLQIAKMLLFVNHESNQPFITMIAGRGPNNYCKIQSKAYKDARRGCQHQDRYEALNLHNKDTVELRIFRGTTKRESFFKSLEFYDCLIHFCGNGVASIKDCTRVDKFIEYVKLHKKDYLHLWAFICARWLREENKLTKLMGFPLPDKPAEVEEYNHEPNPQLRTNEPQF